MTEHWRPIATAPRDGTEVEITAIDDDGREFEIWPMRWNGAATNGLFPEVNGFWELEGGGVTWCEEFEEGAPSHWRPLPKPH